MTTRKRHVSENSSGRRSGSRITNSTRTGVELGQRYRSAAVVGDGTPEPSYTRDSELYYHPTTWPGARLPHCWLGADGHKVSTHDLVGKGRFAVLTGISGQRWAGAAASVSKLLGIGLAAYVIGPGRDYTDLYEDWSRLREVAEDGCVLVPRAQARARANQAVDQARSPPSEPSSWRLACSCISISIRLVRSRFFSPSARGLIEARIGLMNASSG
ncbi:MAG: hypothetical protein WBP81_18100, partial [Solirubrobacteraceae bacterium]